VLVTEGTQGSIGAVVKPDGDGTHEMRRQEACMT
jgi:hypothetical protein